MQRTHAKEWTRIGCDPRRETCPSPRTNSLTADTTLYAETFRVGVFGEEEVPAFFIPRAQRTFFAGTGFSARASGSRTMLIVMVSVRGNSGGSASRSSDVRRNLRRMIE